MCVLTSAAESTWNPVVGAEFLPGLLAWDQLCGGERCETWLAWSTDRWAPVVVRLPRPAEVADADTWQDLVVEARSRGLVEHPGFQRMWDARLEEKVPHLVMEYVEGPGLASVIEQRSLTTDDVVLLGLQLAASLRYLHRQGLVHLNVSPSNVVIREGRAVLLNLGGTTPIGQRRPVGRAPGASSFVAPEVQHGHEVSAASDTFALGVTLYEALVRAPATPKSDPDPPAPPQEVPTLRSVPPQVSQMSPSLADLVLRMLSSEPQRRPDDDTLMRLLRAELPADHPGPWPRWATASLLAAPGVAGSPVSPIRPEPPSPEPH